MQTYVVIHSVIAGTCWVVGAMQLYAGIRVESVLSCLEPMVLIAYPLCLLAPVVSVGMLVASYIAEKRERVYLSFADLAISCLHLASYLPAVV